MLSRHAYLRPLLLAACLLGNLAVSPVATAAQGAGLGQPDVPYMVRVRQVRSSGDSSGSSYRAFMVALPVLNVGNDMALRTEINLYGRASLAIEGNYRQRKEDLTAKEQHETGQSMMTGVRSGMLMLNRYTRPYLMAGFYYGLGVGYRTEDIDWRMAAAPYTAGMALTQSGMIAHEAVARGATGHARIGYRYTGSEVPLLIGVYAGVRHFQAMIDDTGKAGTTTADSVAETQLSEAEKSHLLRRLQTAPEAGLEVGFAF